MTRRKIIIAFTVFVVTAATAMGTLVMLKSVTLAVFLYIGGIVGTMMLVEPFMGVMYYLAFLFLRPQEFVGSLQNMPVALVIGGSTFLLLILQIGFRKNTAVFLKAPQTYLMLAFLSAVVVSNLAHLYLGGAASSAQEFTTSFIMYLIMVNLITSSQKLRLTMYLLLIMIVTLAAQGIWQSIYGVDWTGQAMRYGRIYGRGIFADPNVLAMTFMIIFPFALFKWETAAAPWKKGLLFIAMVILLIGVYLTKSRGGLLTIVVLSGLLFYRRFGLMKGIPIAIVLLAVLIAVAPSRMENISVHEESAHGRVDAWAVGLSLLAHNPVFGVGAHMFLDYHIRQAHNSFVLCAAELGLYGLLIWVMLILVSIRNMNFISQAEHGPETEELAVFAESTMFGLVAFATAGFFISMTYSDLLFILVALSAVVTRLYINSTGERYQLIERKDFGVALLVIVCTIIALKILVSFG